MSSQETIMLKMMIKGLNRVEGKLEMIELQLAQLRQQVYRVEEMSFNEISVDDHEEMVMSLNENISMSDIQTNASKQETSLDRYECDDCSNSYMNLSDLKRHRKLKHTESSKRFNCDQCDKTFARKDILLRHKQNIHK